MLDFIFVLIRFRGTTMRSAIRIYIEINFHIQLIKKDLGSAIQEPRQRVTVPGVFLRAQLFENQKQLQGGGKKKKKKSKYVQTTCVAVGDRAWPPCRQKTSSNNYP